MQQTEVVRRFCFDVDDYVYSGNPEQSSNRLLTRKDLESIFAKRGIHDITIPNQNLDVYQQAFVHKSLLVHGDASLGWHPTESNERLEYLGDSILGAIVAQYLYERFPKEYEGFLTKIRTRLVRSIKLYEFAKNIGLGQFLLVSPQVEALVLTGISKGRKNPRLYEDAFEAFIGAIMCDFGYIDGWRVAYRFVVSILEEFVDFSELILSNENHKDILQRFYQSMKWSSPVYVDVIPIGNSHGAPGERIFHRALLFPTALLKLSFSESIYLTCLEYHKNNSAIFNAPQVSFVQNVFIGIGSSVKKTDAEQQASKQALLNLGISLNF